MTQPSFMETIRAYLPGFVPSVTEAGAQLEDNVCEATEPAQSQSTYRDMYQTSSVERECSETTWTMNWNCGMAEDAPTPKNYRDPWGVHNTSHPFISHLEKKLSTVTDTVERAKIIVEQTKIRMDWQFSEQPSGYSPDQVLATPSGNCVDATVFLLALFKHFSVPSQIAFVEEAAEGSVQHVCLVIKDEDGHSHLADLTRDPSFDVSHPSWYRISERELASMFLVGSGVAFAKNEQYRMASSRFDTALAICPGQPDALIDGALTYMAGEELDLPKAAAHLAALEAIDYHSYWADYARAYYAYLTGDKVAALQALDDAESSCEANQSSAVELRALIQSEK